jgi:hypothetical protein
MKLKKRWRKTRTGHISMDVFFEGDRMENLIGKRFGKLVVIARVLPNDKWNSTRWLCKCDCGNKKVITRNSLIRGTKSCGCLRLEKITTHGKKETRLYKIWEGIKSRCNNPNDTGYKYYGGRGIKVCKEWQNDFESFYKWAIENGYQDNLTLDRINNDGDYEPSNCRWVNMKTQQRNRRDAVYVTINGVTKHLLEWAEIVGIKKQTIVTRYYKGVRGNELLAPPKYSGRWHKKKAFQDKER